MATLTDITGGSVYESDWGLTVDGDTRKKKEEPDPSGANTVDVDASRASDEQMVDAYKASLDSTGAGNDPVNTNVKTPDEDNDPSVAREGSSTTSDYSEYTSDPRRDARNWLPTDIQEQVSDLDVPDGFWTSGEAFDWINQSTSLPDVSGGISSSRTTTYSVEDPDPTKDRDPSGESSAERAEQENAMRIGGSGPHVYDRSQDTPTRGGGGGYSSYRPPQQGESGGGGVLGGIMGMAVPVLLLGGVGVAAYYGASYMGWL